MVCSHCIPGNKFLETERHHSATAPQTFPKQVLGGGGGVGNPHPCSLGTQRGAETLRKSLAVPQKANHRVTM